MKRIDFLKGIFFTSLVGTSLSASAREASSEKKSIFDFGAKGDGVSDDSEAFRKYFQQHQSITLPGDKTFRLGNIVLHNKQIRGPGKIKIASGARSVFILEGQNNEIADINFVSEGSGKRPECEIMLGKELEFASVTGCSFQGKLFSTLGSELNDVKDEAYSKLPWRAKLVIQNCNFQGKYAHHLYFHRLREVIIANNFFQGSVLDSIRLRQWVSVVNISNNHFKDIGAADKTDSKDAIDCYWSGHNLTIVGNQFENISTHGLDIKGHSPDADYGTSKVIIANNQIRKAGFSGILISSGSKTQKGWKAIRNLTVSQNIIEDCGKSSQNPNDAAIFMRHNQEQILIDGNQIIRNKHKGIMLGNFEKDAPNSRNILIKGNMITENGSYGIHISGGENVLVSSNILDKNEKGIVAEPYRNFKLVNYLKTDNIET